MTTIFVSEASGTVLDWMVAKCEQVHVGICLGGYLALQSSANSSPYSARRYSPSNDWAQGGPIIWKEGIGFFWDSGNKEWTASNSSGTFCEVGHTPLIAAMRCYVVTKLGEKVEVPEEML